MSLSRDPALGRLSTKYVCGFRDITGEPYAGESGSHTPDQGTTDTTNGAGSRNLQLFVLAPDGTVLHCLPGYWNPADLVRELDFAEELAQLWEGPGDFASKQDRFRSMQLAHAEQHPPQMRRRSEIQGFDKTIEMSRAAAAAEAGDANPSTTENAPDGGVQLKSTDVIMHERMAIRPFLALDEFDVAAYVDYGGQYYDKHAAHAMMDRALRPVGTPAAPDGGEGAGSGAGARASARASAPAGGVAMRRRDGAPAAPAAGSRLVNGGTPPRERLVRTGLHFAVAAIAGASCEEYSAVLEYGNKSYVVQEGALVPDDAIPVFEVRSVEKNVVTVVVRETGQMIKKRLRD